MFSMGLDLASLGHVQNPFLRFEGYYNKISPGIELAPS
jgi:hypothetical protein